MMLKLLVYRAFLFSISIYGIIFTKGCILAASIVFVNFRTNKNHFAEGRVSIKQTGWAQVRKRGVFPVFKEPSSVMMLKKNQFTGTSFFLFQFMA